MKNNIRKLLKKKRDQEIRNAANEFLKNQKSDISEIANRIEFYNTIIAGLEKSHSSGLIVPLIIATLCVLIAIFLFTIQVPYTKVLLDVDCYGINFSLTKPLFWSAEPSIKVETLSIDGLNTIISSPILGLSIDNPAPDAWITIREGFIALTKLQLTPINTVSGLCGSLELQLIEDESLFFSFANGRSSGALLVSEKLILSAGRTIDSTLVQFSNNLMIPETVSFHTYGNRTVPLDIKVRLQENIVFRNININAIRFSRQISTSPGEIEFASTINKGTLSLHDILKDIQLRDKTHLTLTELEGRIVELRITDKIHILLEGKAKDILIGPAGFRHNLTPKYLDYLYHNRPLSLLWSAVLFIWSILWTIKKFLSKK